MPARRRRASRRSYASPARRGPGPCGESRGVLRTSQIGAPAPSWRSFALSGRFFSPGRPGGSGRSPQAAKISALGIHGVTCGRIERLDAIIAQPKETVPQVEISFARQGRQSGFARKHGPVRHRGQDRDRIHHRRRGDAARHRQDPAGQGSHDRGGCGQGRGQVRIAPSHPFDNFSIVDGRVVTGANPASAHNTAEKAIKAFDSL